MDSESCTRAFSQARVYLEHIRSRVAAGGVDIHGPGKRDYLLDAAKQIRLALERDVSEDYEEAFNHYKNGVDVLLNGVQVDPNKERREAVKRKITKYLKRAEEIFNCHLQRNLGNGNSIETGYSSLRFRPIRTLSTPVENLRRCKVVGIIDKVQIVQDPATGGTFILKSLLKSHVESRERQTIIPHGIPFMAKLLRYSVSEDSIFLHLEHVKGKTLWSYLRSHPCFQHDSCNFSRPSTLEVNLALGEPSEEEHPEEPNSEVQKSCDFCLENRVGQRTSCINHSLPKNTDYSLSWKKSCDHLNSNTVTNQQYIGPVFGSQGVVGTKNASGTYPLSGATESNFKQVNKEQCQQVKQRLIFLSSDSLTTAENTSSMSEKDGTQQEPKQCSGNSSNQCSLKGARGCSISKTETPCGRASMFAHSLVSLTGQRQVYPETPERLPQNCYSQENRWNSASTRGGIMVQRDHKQQKNKPASRKYLTPAHHVPQSDSFEICDINENQIRLWAAELILALEGLHQQQILCKDLNPRNVLLDDTGHIRLTYFGQWTEVEPQFCSQALEELYCAPEVGGISELTEACDWWSVGALLYELLSGMSLSQIHPSGIHRHTQLYLPEKLSQCASSLLVELLQYDPEQRLGSGEDGVSKIKSHPFFSTIQWNKLISY